jgi:hypothetical protein
MYCFASSVQNRGRILTTFSADAVICTNRLRRRAPPNGRACSQADQIGVQFCAAAYKVFGGTNGHVVGPIDRKHHIDIISGPALTQSRHRSARKGTERYVFAKLPIVLDRKREAAVIAAVSHQMQRSERRLKVNFGGWLSRRSVPIFRRATVLSRPAGGRQYDVPVHP